MKYKGHEITFTEEASGTVIHVDGERVDGWFYPAHALVFARRWVDNPPPMINNNVSDILEKLKEANHE